MKNLNYIRIQGRELSFATKQPKGIFAICWRMIYDNLMTKEDEEVFRKIDQWFKEHLPEPVVCKQNAAVITYFKTENTKHMMKKLEPIIELLEKYNHPYDIVYTNFVGTILYEDEYQVAVAVE